jgi:hypothetical protein
VPTSSAQVPKNRKTSAERGMSRTLVSEIGAPMSRVSSSASSSRRASMISAIRYSTARLVDTGVRDQVSNAVRAAGTARSTSAAPPRATVASTELSIGETES